jgi:hypothetical protein
VSRLIQIELAGIWEGILMRKSVVAALVILALSFELSGCSNSDSDSSKGPVGPPPSAATVQQGLAATQAKILRLHPELAGKSGPTPVGAPAAPKTPAQ